jgi:hypothetical protein
MVITDYTSYDEIRSACGLSADDLPDATLSLEMYANTLAIRLGEVSLPSVPPGPGDLAARFIEIKTLDESVRTELEQKLYDFTRLYATYAVAVEVATSLSMRAPKSVSDSKSTLVRFSPESTYELVVEKLTGLLSSTKKLIENIAGSSTDVSDYFAVLSPDKDVVTGV